MENIIKTLLIIFDKSGSMGLLINECMQSLNNLYKEQKESGEFNSTLIFFSDKIEYAHKNLKGSDIPEIKDIVTNGMTGLLDAIGEGINSQLEIEPKNVICVILTDGLENCSKEYSSKNIKELTQKMEEENGWKFIYLGANQNSFDVASDLGINTSCDYEFTPRGCTDILQSLSHQISTCISGKTDIKDIDIDIQTVKVEHKVEHDELPLSMNY